MFIKSTLRRSAFSLIYVDGWVKGNIYEFTTRVIASDAAAKTANIIPDSFISRRPAKPSRDAAVPRRYPSPARCRKCLKRRFCWSVRSQGNEPAARCGLKRGNAILTSFLTLLCPERHGGRQLCVLSRGILGERMGEGEGQSISRRCRGACLKGHNAFAA